MSVLYSIDDHGVVTFYDPADDEERGLTATLRARAANADTQRRATGEPVPADDHRQDPKE
jgi:hypothetical protein